MLPYVNEPEYRKGSLMPTSKRLSALGCVLWAVCTYVTTAQGQSQVDVQKVLIQTPKPYTKLVSDIRAMGGTVRKQYQNVDAIAADIPTTSLKALYALTSASAISSRERRRDSGCGS